MKKRITTYGVYGMMEYQAIVKVGNSSMRVEFTDGSASATGVTPAKFTTSNPITQMAIESSPAFKNGLIKLVQSIERDEEVLVKRNAIPTSDNNEKRDASPSVEEAVLAKGEKEALEFASNDEARDYLSEMYGVAKNKLRTREDMLNVAASFGAEIKFIP